MIVTDVRGASRTPCVGADLRDSLLHNEILGTAEVYSQSHGAKQKHSETASIGVELRKLLIRYFNNLRTMGSADFKLIARLV